MEKQLEEKINEFGKIINSKTTKKTGTHTFSCCYGGSIKGDSFTEEEDVYETSHNYSKPERKKAIRELKKIRKTQSGQEVRNAIAVQLREYKQNLISIIKGITYTAIIFGVIGGCSALQIKGCLKERANHRKFWEYYEINYLKREVSAFERDDFHTTNPIHSQMNLQEYTTKKAKLDKLIQEYEKEWKTNPITDFK